MSNELISPGTGATIIATISIGPRLRTLPRRVSLIRGSTDPWQSPSAMVRRHIFRLDAMPALLPIAATSGLRLRPYDAQNSTFAAARRIARHLTRWVAPA